MPGPVSIPFIAGQWSLPGESECFPLRLRVSIPFIAGQWSLLLSYLESGGYRVKFQSPSLRGSGRFMKALATLLVFTSKGFNPLHCGAVVASVLLNRREVIVRDVSIPFIAGQWSLLLLRHWVYPAAFRFQSPSLRGSGRFVGIGVTAYYFVVVSIPFIAGQWSLLLSLWRF